MAPPAGSAHPVSSLPTTPLLALFWAFPPAELFAVFLFPQESLRQAVCLLFGQPPSPALNKAVQGTSKAHPNRTHKASGLLGILCIPLQTARKLGIILELLHRMCLPELRVKKAGTWHDPFGGVKRFAPHPPQLLLSQGWFPTSPVFQAVLISSRDGGRACCEI